MTVGTDSAGALAVAADTATDAAVRSNFAIARDSGERMLYRVEADPYDPDAAAVQRVQWAQEGPELKISTAYPTRVRAAVNYRADVSRGDVATISGAAPAYGAIRVDVRENEGDTDEWVDYYWDSRPIAAYRGFNSIPESEWEPILTARSYGIRVDAGFGYLIEVNDPSSELRDALQQDTYAGTGRGTIEGPEDLEGVPRPIVVGKPKNVRPREIDNVSYVYQASDKALDSISAVYDQGVALTANPMGPDITDFSPALADVWAWSPNVSNGDGGTYITDLANGLIRLAGTPAGTVTCDPVLDQGSNRHSDIADYLLRTYAGLGDSDLELQAFAALGVANNDEAALYLRTPTQPVLSVLSEFLRGILAFWFYTPSGKLAVAQVRANAGYKPVLKREDIFELTGLRNPLQHKTRRLLFDRAYTVQSGDDIAAGADADHADFVGEEYRVAEKTASIPQRLGAVESETQTYLVDRTESEAECQRQIDLLSADRMLWQVRFRGSQFKLTLGQSVRVDYPRYSFPRNLIILSLAEDSSSNMTTILGWG